MNQLEESLYKYFKAVEEVRNQNDLNKEEKLKRLLDPIVDLQNSQSSPNWRHKFAREDFINLDEEIDCSFLENTSKEWTILPNWKLQQFGDIDTNDEIISVNYQKFLPEIRTNAQIGNSVVRTSVHRLYKDWLPHLSLKRIQNKSLLDQILVCYAIKRAQNGDQQAGEKLISLYEGTASSKQTHENVLKMLVWRENNFDSSKKTDLNYGGESDVSYLKYDDDFRQNAIMYLVFIIRGFNPKSLLDALTGGLNPSFPPIPRDVFNVFLYYYGEYVPGIAYKYLDYLSSAHEYLKEPGNTQKLIKIIESMINVLECFSLQEDANLKIKNLDILKNNAELLPTEQVMEAAASIVPIVIKIPDAIAPYVVTLLDPYTPISSETSIMKSDDQRTARILGVCYRPQKMSPRKNLTTWLFGGTGKSYVLGKLYQALCDHYSLETNSVVATSPFKESSEFDQHTDEYTKEDEALRKHTESRIYEEKERVHRTVSVMLDLQASMKKAKISKEDYEFLLDHFRESTLEDLAEKYNLTKDQVRYKLETSLNKLKKTIT